MKKAFILIWFGCVTWVSCYGATEPNHTADNNDVKKVVAGNTDFALTLYGKLKDVSPKENLFFSPYSISTALAIAYAGARGETEEQMAKVLHFTLPGPRLYPAFGTLQNQLIQNKMFRGYKLLLANALWLQKGEPFLKEFLDLAGNYYGAGLNQLDFINETEKSRQTINNWVEEKTNDKIEELIPPNGVNPNTELVLTNAIYFKGQWKTKFKWWRTRRADFNISNKDKVEVRLMHLTKVFKYCENEKMQVLELPYKSEELSMLVLLPKGIEGIKQVEDTLKTENINTLLSEMWNAKVDVYFPRFKMMWGTFVLNNTLAALGMSNAFIPEKADFSGINGKKDLCISNVFHKAWVEVNEEGTEAAAATAVGYKKGAAGISAVFRADHPFIFIIKDNRSGSILFMGRVMNPAEES
jgi:serpin B